MVQFGIEEKEKKKKATVDKTKQDVGERHCRPTVGAMAAGEHTDGR